MKIAFLSAIAKLLGITFRIDGIAFGKPVDMNLYER